MGGRLRADITAKEGANSTALVLRACESFDRRFWLALSSVGIAAREYVRDMRIRLLRLKLEVDEARAAAQWAIASSQDILRNAEEGLQQGGLIRPKR